jgi:hypothetical protein
LLFAYPLRLFKLGDKYGADQLLQTFVLFLRPFIVKHPATASALGAIYDRLDILVEALQHFGDEMQVGGKQVYDPYNCTYRTEGSINVYGSNAGCVSLRTAPEELLERIPLKIMVKFDALKDAILVDQKGTWANLSSEMDWKVGALPSHFLVECSIGFLTEPFLFPIQDDCYGDVRLRKA